MFRVTLAPIPTIDPITLGRGYGAVLGAAVGDAIASPLATPSWSTDTQLAVVIGEQIATDGGIHLRALFGALRTWLRAGPAHVGISTRTALESRHGWSKAASAAHAAEGVGWTNGALARSAPLAVFLSTTASANARMSHARAVSGLTHGDPSAGWGAAILCEVVRAALVAERDVDRERLLDQLPMLVTAAIPEARSRAKWERTVHPGWTPAAAEEANGAVWPALGTALWACRSAGDFEGAVLAAVLTGGDARSVGAVTGAIAGAIFGQEAIAPPWLEITRGEVPSFGRAWDAWDLRSLTRELLVAGRRP